MASVPTESKSNRIRTRELWKGGLRGALALVVAAGGLTAACGTDAAKEANPLDDDARNGIGTKEGGVGSVQELAFTVPPRPTSFDLVFFVDDEGGHRSNDTVRNRMTDVMQGFFARLKFAQGDLNLAFAPASVPDLNNNGEPIEAQRLDKGYGLWRDEADANEILSYTIGKRAPDAVKALYERNDALITERLFRQNDESYQFAPVESLRRVARLASAAPSGLRGKNGKTFTHIVLMATRADKGDETQPADVITTFNETFKGGWFLTVIALPENGCDVGDEAHTVIGKPLKADGKPSGQMYRPFALAKAAGARAKFVSLCETNFNPVFQDLASSPAGEGGSVVDLKAKAVAKSIAVTTDKGTIGGWKYVPGETKLTLPPFLKPGTKIKVVFSVHDGKSANPLPSAIGAPAVVDKKLSPEELLFVQKADPILQRGCSGCHSPGGGRTVYPGNFANVRSNKATIKERINKPAADPLKMPKDRTLSAADITALTQYLDGLK